MKRSPECAKGGHCLHVPMVVVAQMTKAKEFRKVQ